MMKSKQGILILCLFGTILLLSSCGPAKQPNPSGQSKNKPSDSSSSVSAEPQNVKQPKSVTADSKTAEKSLDAKTSINSKMDDEPRIYDYLRNQIPEIKNFEQQTETYNKQNKTDYKVVMRIDSKPDPGSNNLLDKDYYYVYIGNDMGDHMSRWASFWVKPDLTDILVDDVLTGTPVSLEEWRRTQEDRGY